MGKTFSPRAGRVLSAVAGTAVLFSAACGTDAGPPLEPADPAAARPTGSQAPFYYHQRLPVYLEADPQRLVVATDLPPAAAEAAVRAVAGAQASSSAELRGAPGHRVVRLAGADRASAAAAVARLRADGRFRFASTAFRTVGGGADVLLLDRVIVRFVPGATPAQVQATAASLGLRVLRAPDPARGERDHWLAYPAGADPLAIAAQLDRNPLVAWADPDKVSDRRLQWVPTDPYYGYQYNLKNTALLNGIRVDINAEAAWDLTRGASTIRVAVIDNGVDAANADLALNGGQQFDTFYPYVNAGETAFTPLGNDSHGTAVAGIIAMIHNNGLGGAGIAPGVQVNAARIFRGGTANTDARIADAINWAWQTAASDVLSNSWNGGAPSNAITAAINDATTLGRGGKGAVVVFSGGNTSNRGAGLIGAVAYPATLPNVIAVGAINRNGALTNYSPEGPELDIVAPTGHNTSLCGVGDVLSADLWGAAGCNDGPGGDQNFTGTFSGTSAAAPQVAGAAALLLSREPALTRSLAQSRILDNADPWGAASQYGRGKLNLYRTLNVAPAAPLDSIAIGGSSPVRPNVSCSYQAGVYGGTAPYTYRWYRNSVAFSSASRVTVSTGTATFTLRLEVTDARGLAKSRSRIVTVSSTAPACIL